RSRKTPRAITTEIRMTSDITGLTAALGLDAVLCLGGCLRFEKSGSRGVTVPSPDGQLMGMPDVSGEAHTGAAEPPERMTVPR
ncbi:MAG: hypothetical protein QW410_03605, partial [Nitrososphaerota archaeon]